MHQFMLDFMSMEPLIQLLIVCGIIGIMVTCAKAAGGKYRKGREENDE